jgi:putative hemolysin
LPSTLHTYLKLGAKICGMPAIDREFRTIDFFTILDLHEIKWR